MARISPTDNVLNMPTTEASESAEEITRDAIARRAYEIYMDRGGADGHDVDDWLQAERELHEESIRATA
jgi:hypothetical protein